MIFSFDWSTDSLVFPAPPHGRPSQISVAALKALGWRIEPAEARKSLPRFDRSLLERAMPASAANAARKMGQA